MADKRFWVPQEVYNPCPLAGNVRVFYLPRIKHIVNMEHLLDAGLPAGTLTTWDMITAMKGMTFAANGTATVDFPRGNRHSGRWTADAD